MENLAKVAYEQLKLVNRMENIGKTAYEQLESFGLKCDKPFCYRGLVELIHIGRNGIISIEEKDNNFEYWYARIPKGYAKKIDRVMKNIGVKRK